MRHPSSRGLSESIKQSQMISFLQTSLDQKLHACLRIWGVTQSCCMPDHDHTAALARNLDVWQLNSGWSSSGTFAQKVLQQS